MVVNEWLSRLGGSRGAVFGGAGIELVSLHDVGDVNGAFALDDLALGVLLALAHVFLDHARTFDDHPLFLAFDGNDAAALALVGSGDDHYFIVFLHMKSAHG